MKTDVDEDEVEQLLRAAQDDALLKLSVNSHIARASSDAINSDLDRRFQALKKASTRNTKPPPKIDNNPPNNSCKEKISTVGNGGVDDMSGTDDLFAIFAMLKKSLPAYNSNGVGVGEYKGDSSNHVAEEDNGDEDEVEKLIKWAVDAARLDPSPPSDDDDDPGEQTDDDHDDDDEDEDEDDDAKKRKTK